ncbi:MAG: hypothetical protein COV35_01145 [Alphaproteobacteria bacterium CG11_big_fil_rev_8_21_14_0_20_39_49]|nr:MAG: hypothetical protein COV35_01145 [Alphaproteobacteria bacterium CG11_big_fil_rev_8_21_14_0_20_39_49]
MLELILNTKILNSIGLGLDIIGVVLIFFFGIPQKMDRSGDIFIVLGEKSPNEIKKIKKYDFWANTGLILIVSGFVIQIISNFL